MLKLKLDEDGHVVVQDGKPIYVDDQGKDVVYDLNASNATITRLNNESKDWRTKFEESNTELTGLKEKLEGIDDIDKAKAALETVSNLDQGSLVSTGKVQEIKDAAKRSADEQVASAVKASERKAADAEARATAAESALHSEKIGNHFTGGKSKYIADKIAIPADLLQDKFGRNFKYEDNKVVGYGVDGQKIYSRNNPGELAGFDEALEIMIEAYPSKDMILKGTQNSGGGTEHQSGGVQRPGFVKGNMGGTHKERVEALKSRFPELDKQ